MRNVYMGTDLEEFIFDESMTYEASCKENEDGDAKTKEEDDTVEESEFEVTDEEINTYGVIECVEDHEVACYRIALENEQNYNSIMNAFMVKEFNVLESTGAEMVYEAADVKNFFEAVKKTINLWWSKIQGVIKNVIGEISKRTDLNKAFVKRYKGKDIKAPSKEFGKNGYDFSDAKTPNFVSAATSIAGAIDLKKISSATEEEATEYIEHFKGRYETTVGYIRGALCGTPTKVVSGEDFDKQLKVACFGSEEKVSIKLKPFATLLNDLDTAKEAKNDAKAAYKKAQDAVKALQKNIKMAENELRKADRKNAGMKIAKCMTDTTNATLSLMSKAMSVYTKAMVAKVSQDRAMAAFYITNQSKKEKESAKNESAFENDLGIVLV